MDISLTDRIINEAKDKLPPAPPIAFKLLSMLRNTQKQDNDEIIEIIRFDPDLTANLLRLCNSGVFRATVPIASLEQAVLRLGYSTLMERILSISFGKVYPRIKSPYGCDAYKLWRHSVASALAAKNLIPHCTGLSIDPHTGFTACLLHDIGKTVLNVSTQLPGLEIIRIKMIQDGLTWSEAERLVLGTDHAEIGATLLHRWGLPSEIVTAVQYHNTPEIDESGLASLVNSCSLCAMAISSSSTWTDFKTCVDAQIPKILGLDENKIDSAMSGIAKDAGALEAYMMVA